jgi:uncharacterized membrane protein YeaQ/YmgE (transglycosylase-associated protein family)
MIATIIWFIVIGLIAGAVARLLVPGRDPMGIVATIVLGIVGSFVGGFLAALFFAPHRFVLSTSGIIGSIIGAIILLLILRAFRARRVA